MEFRQVLRQVCRTTAAATRPSLAGTRLTTPSTLLLQHRRNFTTDGSNPPGAGPHQPSLASPPRTPSPLVSAQQQPLQPPRPQFVRKTKSIQDSQINSKLLSWKAPPGHRLGRGSLTGRAAAASGNDDLFGVNADMRNATAGLANWQPDEFLTGREDTEMRLSPATGRTVQVNKSNVDLARALSLLNKTMKRNRVRFDMNAQKYHERPALKRKRKLRERWQKRFNQGFFGVLQRVRELKGQGW